MASALWIYKDSKRINVKAGIKSSPLQVRGPSGCYHYYFIIIVIAFQDFTRLVKKPAFYLLSSHFWPYGLNTAKIMYEESTDHLDRLQAVCCLLMPPWEESKDQRDQESV